MKHFSILLPLMLLLPLMGCREPGTGTSVGTVGGAAAGAAIGSTTGDAGKGALIGAGVGALGGYMYDSSQDRKRGYYDNRCRKGYYLDNRGYCHPYR